MNVRKLINDLKKIIQGKAPATQEKHHLRPLGVTSRPQPRPTPNRTRGAIAEAAAQRALANRQARQQQRPPVNPPPRPPEPQPEPQQVDQATYDLLVGTMQTVSSSNVHSFGMRIQEPGDRTGTLLVRYLAIHAGGERSGPGSLYAYHSVPVTLFREFQRAASAGIFVWDNLRQRGQIAGGKYAYELVGVASQYVASLGQTVENYVPRQATLLRGAPGQHFIQRTQTVGEIRNGRYRQTAVRSQLSPAQASMRGPNPTRGPSIDELRLGGGQP
jgi:hypothetical protein